MRCSFKIFIAIVCITVITAGSLSSCASSSNEPITNCELWVLTVNTGSEYLIEEISERFQEEHPGVTVRIDTGPDTAEEWEQYLEQLQIQIMAGHGPDVILNLSENISTPTYITDVNQFMRNGLCLDLTAYYEQDTELDKAGLVSSVMDAGVVDGARYVLPLRYNIPVIYADVQQLEAVGLRADDLQNGLSSLAEVAPILDAGAIASDYGDWFFNLYWMNCLSELIDYDAQQVALDRAELIGFLDDYRKLTFYGIDTVYVPALGSYIRDNNSFWALNGNCIFLGTLDNLAQNLRIAKAAGIDLAVLPLTASDGSVIANVSYYGAIGANTNNPDLAYEFLREFLLEENQWENNLGKSLSTLIDCGWPVLTKNSWSDLDADLLRMLSDETVTDSLARERKARIRSVELVEEDFSILNTEFEDVRFFPATQWNYMMEIERQLNIKTNPDAMTVDINALAEEILQELTWDLAEG